MELLEKLKGMTLDSTVYIGYYKPKTQTELLKFIYGDRNVNITSIKKARDRLTESGYLIMVSKTGALRNIPLKSTPDPFIEYLKDKSESRVTTMENEHKLNDVELKYIKLLIDSDYFRDTFFSDYFFENCYGLHRWLITADEKGKTVVISAFSYLETMLSIMLLPALFLSEDFKGYFVQDIEEVITRYTDSNEFIENYFERLQGMNFKDHLQDNKKVKLAFSHLSDSDCNKYFYSNVINNGAFLLIPPSLSRKLAVIIEDAGLGTYYVAFLAATKSTSGSGSA